jgi:threonylcarbamoyladenosine tRNA methylthiotransferase MtaB
MQKRASIHTLGCRLNQAESLLIRNQLEEEGYTIVPYGDPADLGIINTCTVTREADAKCRQIIRKFIRANPNAFTAVLGCYSQMGAKMLSSIKGVDLILGNQDKLAVLDFAKAGKSEHPLIIRDKIDKNDFSIQFVGNIPYNKRANLKVQEGCNFMCSFCIIPFARGRSRSRDWDNMLEEARNLVSCGVRELILTGINIGTYDNKGHTIVDMCDALNEIKDLIRVRISSIEPTTVPLELLDRMADPKHALVPYLHLPIQACNDRILTEMRRKYTIEEYLEFAHEALNRVPDLCLGTDIMVGFPGETEEEFENTCRFFQEEDFAYCHVFPFSERDGTQIMRRKDVEFVPVRERQKRANHLRRLSAIKHLSYLEAHLGKEMEVLFEDPKPDHWPGYTENYIRVIAHHETEDLTNRLARVRLDSLHGDFIEGTVLEMLSD